VLLTFETDSKENLKDLSVERLGPQLNDQPPRKDLTAEFGLSFHVETQRGAEVRNVLIDFGITPEVLLNNLAILKIDPASLDALVISTARQVTRTQRSVRTGRHECWELSASEIR
jgi:7,8-dihydropterin-6-yl-methyl-4-(beta-D-ribofuranosyl)aminobenzene 5'-phosphate synthase